MLSHSSSANAVNRRRNLVRNESSPVLAALHPLWDVDASGWFAYGPDGRLAYVNRAFRRLTASQPEIGTMELVPTVAYERRSAVRRAFDRLRAGEQTGSSWIVPVVVNGEEQPLHLSLASVDDRTAGNHVVGVLSPVVRTIDHAPNESRAQLLEQVLGRVMHAVASVLPDEADAPQLLDRDDLSTRQRQVLGLLLRGERPSAVAATLHLSTHTVRNYQKAIFRKFGVHSQSELIALSRAMRRHPSAARNAMAKEGSVVARMG